MMVFHVNQRLAAVSYRDGLHEFESANHRDLFRKGGQIAHEKNEHDIAVRIFASTMEGKVIIVDISTNDITELIAGGRYAAGLTVQTFLVPVKSKAAADLGAAAMEATVSFKAKEEDAPQKMERQVRLYLTLGSRVNTLLGSEFDTKYSSAVQIVRVNVNGLEVYLKAMKAKGGVFKAIPETNLRTLPIDPICDPSYRSLVP